MPTTENKKHAKYSPSTLKSRQICPGYEPSSEASEASLQGTRLHSYVECSGDVVAAKKSFEKDNKPHKWELSEEEQAWGDSILQYVRDTMLNFKTGKPLKRLREHAIDLKPLKIDGMDKGTADTIIWETKTKAHLMDWKFGWGEIVDVILNLQFKAYAVGLFHEDPNLQEIVVHMVQPKLDLVDVETFTRDQVELFTTQLGAVVKRCIKFKETQDETMLNMDETNCTYCAAQAMCPAWAKAAFATAALMIDSPHPDDDPDRPPMIRAEDIPNVLATGWDIESADPIALAQMLALITPMEAYLKKLKSFAHDVHISGHELPGFSVVSSQGKTSIISPIDAKDVAVENFGVTDDEVLACCDVSLTKLKELVGTKSAKGEKGKDAVRLVELLDDQGIVERSGGYSYLKRIAKRSKE